MKILERLIWATLVLTLAAVLFWYQNKDQLAGRGDYMNFIDRLHLMQSINEEDWEAVRERNDRWLRWELYSFNKVSREHFGLFFSMSDDDYDFLMNRIEKQFPELLDTIDDPPPPPGHARDEWEKRRLAAR